MPARLTLRLLLSPKPVSAPPSPPPPAHWLLFSLSPSTHPCPLVSEALALPGVHRAGKGCCAPALPLPCCVTLGQPLALSGPVTSSGTRAAGSAFDGSVMQTHTGGGGERDQGLPEAETEFQTFWLFPTQPVLCITCGPQGRRHPPAHSFTHSTVVVKHPVCVLGQALPPAADSLKRGHTSNRAPEAHPTPVLPALSGEPLLVPLPGGPFLPLTSDLEMRSRLSLDSPGELSPRQSSPSLVLPFATVQAPLLFPATCFSVSPTDWDLPRQGPAFVSWHPCRPWPGKTPITFFLKLW